MMSIERPTDKLKWLIGEWRKTAASEGGMNGLGIGFEFCANEAEVLSFALEFQVSEQDAELTRLRARCEKLEAVAVAARALFIADGFSPAMKRMEYIQAALAALDQQPQQGQEVSK